MPDVIYLDNASTTKPSKRVLDAMESYLTEQYGNPNSLHLMGRKAYEAVEEAREKVAKAIGGESKYVVFTSSGTEANNMALIGMASYLKEMGKTNIITTQVEHRSVLECAEYLRTKLGFGVTYLPGKQDKTLIKDLKNAVNKETGFVSIMYTNNETGLVNPISDIASFLKHKGILFHSDMVQALGFEEVNVREMQIPIASFSGHKIHTPAGIGVLYNEYIEEMS
jgi:cysteine desulfurase